MVRVLSWNIARKLQAAQSLLDADAAVARAIASSTYTIRNETLNSNC